jgi:deoxycytidylate deaminase
MNTFIELAYKTTEKSNHPKHQLGCVITRGGAVLSVAANRWDWGKCCERRAIRPHCDYRGAVLIVVRSNKKMSKPCSACRIAIEKAGIKKIVYIDWNGNVVIEKV